ncbi:hypothetical protein GQ457_11G029530 [Hibiscus cannabinus]
MVQTESRDIPAMDPELVDASTPISIMAQSIAYVTIRDFEAPASFNPLRIKVGGSLQDNVVYKVGEVKSCPDFRKREGGLFGFSQGCLSMERWDQLNRFFNLTGVKLTFGLNALSGRNESQPEKGFWIGDWQPQNTRDFMKYTISKGYKVDSYEFGNQLYGSGTGASVDAEQYAKYVVVLKNLVKELYGHPETQPMVLGPGCFYKEKWFNTFLEVLGQGFVDGVAHHIYNLGPGDDPNLMGKILDPFYFNQVSQTYKGVLDVINKFKPQLGAWVSESGGAFNSGSKDVSRTFADGFCALLWNRLMGSTVLAVSKESDLNLRVYAHCAKRKTESWDIPAMDPELVDASTPISIAAQSIAYVTIRDFEAPACA